MSNHGGKVALAMGALGIVYGDIGTSPIYALREAFEHNDLTVDKTNAYGVASLVFWALVVIISIKYLLLVMKADNKGEGASSHSRPSSSPSATRPTRSVATGGPKASLPWSSRSACSAPRCSMATA